jgi:hypothetical protein
MSRRQRHELIALAVEHSINADDQRTNPLLGNGREGRFEIAFAPSAQDLTWDRSWPMKKPT